MLSEKYRTSYRGKGMEIVFLSSDRDERSFKEYFDVMPWLALPFSASGIKQTLATKYGIRGIPALIVLDATKPGASVITADGREHVLSDSTGSKFFGVSPMQAFPGSGQSLGGGASSAGPADTSSAAGSIVIDRTKPVTTIQIRFPDGKKVAQEFNSSAKCSEVLSFVSRSLGSVGGRKIKLCAGFPMKEIADLSDTVTAAGVANSQVTVQID